MKSIALAVLVATLAGCAVVPVGPPIVVGARYDSGGSYGWRDRGPRPYYGPYWRRY